MPRSLQIQVGFAGSSPSLRRSFLMMVWSRAPCLRRRSSPHTLSSSRALVSSRPGVGTESAALRTRWRSNLRCGRPPSRAAVAHRGAEEDLGRNARGEPEGAHVGGHVRQPRRPGRSRKCANSFGPPGHSESRRCSSSMMPELVKSPASPASSTVTMTPCAAPVDLSLFVELWSSGTGLNDVGHIVVESHQIDTIYLVEITYKSCVDDTVR